MKKVGPDSGKKVTVPASMMNEAIRMAQDVVAAEVNAGVRKNPSPAEYKKLVADRTHQYLLDAFNHSLIPQAGVRENPSKASVSKAVLSQATEFFGPSGVLSEKKFPKGEIDHQRWRLLSASSNISHMVMDMILASSGFRSRESKGVRSSFDYPNRLEFTGGTERPLNDAERERFKAAMIEVEKYRTMRMVMMASVLQLITPLFRGSNSEPKGPDSATLNAFVNALQTSAGVFSGKDAPTSLNQNDVKKKLFREIWSKLAPLNKQDMDLLKLRG